MPISWIHSSTYHRLNIRHQMIKAGPNDTNQLTTSIDCPRVWPLVVAPVPFLRASLHLSHVIGSQGQALEMTMSGNGTRGNEVVQRKTVEGPEHTSRTLHRLVDGFGRWIGPVWIVASRTSVLDVVLRLETLKPSV